MSKSARLTLAEIRAVMRLASDARELRGTPQLQHEVLLDGMVDLLGGERAFSIQYASFSRGSVPRLEGFHVQARIDATFRSYLEQSAEGVTPWDDPMVVDACDHLGPARANTLSRCWPNAAAGTFALFAEYQSHYKIADRMSCCFGRPGVPPGLSGFEVQRMDRAPAFGLRSIAMGQLLVEELQLLHRRGQLEPPADPLAVLPPRQREVARRILSGQTAKRIAFEMHLSIHTVREHLQTIYRKFGVDGRDELMSRFVRR